MVVVPHQWREVTHAHLPFGSEWHPRTRLSRSARLASEFEVSPFAIVHFDYEASSKKTSK